MASISSVINASSIYAYEAQQAQAQQKPTQSYNPTDTVELSKAALAALTSGDNEYSGDRK